MMRALLLPMLALGAAFAAPASAQKIDVVPRTIVMTAFAPEWNAMTPMVDQPTEHHVNGLTFLTGTMAGKPVLLMQSGVSMVNAAMNTQLALDRFTVKRIVFSGIAGGVDPGLSIGDVIVPDHWAQYLEVSFARQTPKGWATPEPIDPTAPANHGMMFPRGVQVGNATTPAQRHYSFAADPALIALARTVATTVTLRRCVEEKAPASTASACLAHTPRIVVGGTGVSAGVFADNAEFRDYLAVAWHARVLDMESAAVAQVAYANDVPAIAFRSLSDLAGGDAGGNQMYAFMHLAAVNSAHMVHAFVAALPD